MLIILFGPMYRYTPVPLERRSAPGWILVVLMFCAQMAPIFVYGDEKLTMEANRYGLYMFEANHQCVSTTTIIYTDGREVPSKGESANSMHRCDPYKEWFRLHVMCMRDPFIAGIRWTYDHSINGGPFLRIVDASNACALTYTALGHNDWIKTEYDNPEVVGYPVQNFAR
jgi:hypothetical protein